MKLLMITALTAVLWAPTATAAAAVGSVIPPSNPAANQYVEGVPTATGTSRGSDVAREVSARTLHPKGTGDLTRRVVAALARQGSDGVRAETLARAGAPRGLRALRRRFTAGRHTSPGDSAGGESQIAALVRALIGAGTQGGLGSALPLVLGLSAISFGLVALRRVIGMKRRRTN